MPHSKKEQRLATRAVHLGREDLGELKAHVPPIDLSSTYPVTDLASGTASLEALAGGAREADDYIYSRLYNPTVARWERAIAALESGEDGIAFASGMAATTAVLLAARELGGHVVAVRPLYGGTDSLLVGGITGMEVTFAEPDEVAQAMRPDTALVILETPANPTLSLVDIASVVRQAGDVAVLVDSTFSTPVLQRPLELGATIVLHSATKFLGGHGDVVAGVIVTNDEWARRVRRVRVATGGILHPLAAYLLHRGLATLPLRVERAQATAQELARRLDEAPEVVRVHYPGLPGADPTGLIGRQMSGPGSVLAFELEGGYKPAAACMEAMRLATPAVSLGSVDTLIQHPAGLTHRGIDPAVRLASGIADGMLRLSPGLEDVEDLWADLRRGLDAAADALRSIARGQEYAGKE
ncbi:MAG TPA: PLP-dependent aspartate aminotransferase family protein [Gemmatimonadales bacterium]|nr:PLP-dependent aspartate aminotransferase family protein [Gemmatimonadales bacterium]